MSKKNKKFKFPKRSPLLYLLLIIIPVVLFFAIAIPVKYVSTYNEQRVYVFADYAYDKITHDETDSDGHTHTTTTYKKKENITWGDTSVITDFDLYLYCNEYKDGSTVSFGVFGVKNENTASLNIKQFTIRLGMFNTWLNVNTGNGSSRSVTLVDNAIVAIKNGVAQSSPNNPSISLSLNVNLPAKGPLPFTGVDSLPVYAFISYEIRQNGENIKKEFVIELDYEQYMIEKTIIDAGTSNETYINPSIGGIQK